MCMMIRYNLIRLQCAACFLRFGFQEKPSLPPEARVKTHTLVAAIDWLPSIQWSHVYIWYSFVFTLGNYLSLFSIHTVHPIQYTYGFVVVILSVPDRLMLLFYTCLQDCFIGTGAIIWLPQCQWSNPEGHPAIRHNKTQVVCVITVNYCSVLITITITFCRLFEFINAQ